MRSRHLGLIAILIAAGLISWSMSSGSLQIPGTSKPYEADEEEGDESGHSEGQDSREATEPETEPVNTVFRSDFVDFGYRDITHLAIQTQAEWEALWEPTGEDPPTIDFEAHTVLVASLGQKPSAGHSVNIKAVNQSEEGVVVHVEVGVSGSGCVVASVLTYPVHMVEIPKAEGPFTFELDLSVHHCND